MSVYESFPGGDPGDRIDGEGVGTNIGAAPLASRWRRFWALLLDGLLMLFVSFLVGLVVSLILGEEDNAVGVIVLYATWATLLLLYMPLTMARNGARNGQTYGKQLLRVRVVTREGVPVTFWRGVRRDVLGTTLLNVVTGGLYAFVDCPFALVDGRRQALHDKIAATYVLDAAGSRPADGDRQQWRPPSDDVQETHRGVSMPAGPDDMQSVFGR